MSRVVCLAQSMILVAAFSPRSLGASPLKFKDTPGMGWETLADADTHTLVPSDEEILELPVTAKQVLALPAALIAKPRLAYLALTRRLSNPSLFDLGVYGKVGSSTVFFTTLDHIDSWDRLYWVMVRVLSEKYGCFMTAKTQIDQFVHVRCRDGRKIVMSRSRGPETIQFYGRQFDASGRELVVENRKVLTRIARP